MTKEEPKNLILSRQQAAFDYLSNKRKLWDKMEQLNHGMLGDAISMEAKSQVFDHRLSTLNDERANRVMAQLPLGKVTNMSKNDMGSPILMNLMLEKYVFKNANAQFPFLTKLRMIDTYSGPYGNVFALTDWDVKPNGYVGPDIWMLNIRDVFPQVGAVSVEDSDYIIVRTWRPYSFFEGLKDKGKKDGYKNMGKLLDKLKGKTGSKDSRDSQNLTKREEDQYSTVSPAKGKGYFEVLSQYERDTWTDYCVDADVEFRQIDNPHENGELPITCKYSIPLLEDFMGTSKFQRGASMQNVANSVWNLYLDAVKMSIFPPIMVNKDNIAAMSTIKWGPAAKWMVRNQIQNAIQPVNLSPQGIQTFQNTHQAANASLTNLFGTSDTTISSSDDISQGKTPQALKMQAARENTGDNADRFYMEQFLSQTIKKMVNLLSKKQSSAISIRMFEDEIKELAEQYPDVAEMYNPRTGKLVIDKKTVGSAKWDYEVISGSTYALDKQAEQDSLRAYIQMYLENGQVIEQLLQRDGFKLKFGEMFKSAFMGSNIKNWQNFLEEMTDEEKADLVLDKDKQAFEQAMQQQMAGGQQPINSVPQQPTQ
jgi:hypothetical protein